MNILFRLQWMSLPLHRSLSKMKTQLDRLAQNRSASLQMNWQHQRFSMLFITLPESEFMNFRQALNACYSVINLFEKGNAVPFKKNEKIFISMIHAKFVRKNHEPIRL